MEAFTVFLIGATSALGCMAFGLGVFMVGSNRRQSWERQGAFASALHPQHSQPTRRV